MITRNNDPDPNEPDARPTTHSSRLAIQSLADPLPDWLDDRCRELLRAIRDPERAKKRRTVIELAFAIANQQPLEAVFKRPDCCSKQIWYGDNRTLHSGAKKPGWQDLPDVHAAFEACKERALDYVDEQTAALEAHYTRQRRQAIARYSAQAPAALASVMASPDQRGADRINAALALIKLADPDTRDVANPQPAAEAPTQTVTVEAGRLDELLLKTLYPDPAPDPAAPPAQDGPDAHQP